VPNHIFVMLTLGASAWVGLTLQRRRIAAQAARDAAIDARETNRLLMSLIAHDLRAPLATALHAFDYLEMGADVGDELIRETRGRLRRSLRVIDAFLSIRSGGHATPPEMRYITARQLESILAEEVRAFEPEALSRQKTLDLETGGFEEGTWLIEVMVVRQALTILIDNAVRHALPGAIRVGAWLADDHIKLTVEDSGPGLGGGAQEGEKGAGLGLELCGALVRRSGGSLEVVRNDPAGTTFRLSLPARAAEDALVATPAPRG
jgi:signal transduction histidine kinase